MFSFHGADGPESSTTSCFKEVRQVAVPVGRKKTAVLGRIHYTRRHGGQSLLSTIAFFVGGAAGGINGSAADLG